jgi:hypothetical protein
MLIAFVTIIAEIDEVLLKKGERKMAKERRFIVSDKEGKLVGTKIITDSETGVQYLFVIEGYAGGLTVLVDKDGKPLVDKNQANMAI